MENEMIERVAQAILATGNDEHCDVASLAVCPPHVCECRARARAAIAAMREPTEAMECEYFNALTGNRREVGRKVYRAMIDAALKSE